MSNPHYLSDVTVIVTGLNLPAPRAAQILHDMGARIIKIEPPSGDTFAYFCPPWYQAMLEGVTCLRLDLKTSAGLQKLYDLLSTAQILITSQRPAALIRMGLESQALRELFPHLAIVNIVGAPDADAHIPGHDLTYQARAGLIAPPQMPRSLVADLAGAQQAAITALALLHAGGGVAQVALSEAAQAFHAPLAYQLTRPGDFLGGGHAGYNIYETSNGYIALAALEHYFWPALRHLFPELPDDPLSTEAHQYLQQGFRQQATTYWVQKARQHDIPLEAIVT